MARDYAKEAEKNMVKVAREFELMLEVLDGLAVFGNNYTHEWIGGKHFFEGLTMMRDAIYREYSIASMNAMMFAGLKNSEESKKFIKEKLERMFSGRDSVKYSVMNFLESTGRYPSSYLTEDEEKFREQVKENLDAP